MNNLGIFLLGVFVMLPVTVAVLLLVQAGLADGAREKENRESSELEREGSLGAVKAL